MDIYINDHALFYLNLTHYSFVFLVYLLLLIDFLLLLLSFTSLLILLFAFILKSSSESINLLISSSIININMKILTTNT